MDLPGHWSNSTEWDLLPFRLIHLRVQRVPHTMPFRCVHSPFVFSGCCLALSPLISLYACFASYPNCASTTQTPLALILCVNWGKKSQLYRRHWMFYVLFFRKVQWSHLASLKNNVSPVSRSHSFSDPSPKFAHHHLRSQDPYPPSRSEVLSQSSDSKSEVPDPTQKAWARSDSDEVPPRVRSRKTEVWLY